MIRAIRRWARRHGRKGRYTPVGIAFHWVMAGLVLYQLWSGWMLERYLVGGDKLQAYQLHSEIGLTLLLLASLRFVWRLIVPGPFNDADRLGWQTTAAHATHILFYALFALLPISGWAMWSALQPVEPLSLAGVIPIPAMPFYDLSPGWQRWVLDKAEDVHGVGVVGLALLVPLHVVAALKHHFWEKHDVDAIETPSLNPPRAAPPADLPALLSRLQDVSNRPRYAFMVLNLILRAAGPSGRARPYVREGDALVPVRDWLSDALAPMAGRAPSRLALAQTVRGALAAAGRLPADTAEAERLVDAEVTERMRKTNRSNVSHAVSDLVRAGLVQRYYKGYRVDHDNRGAGRQAVYVVTAPTRAALATSGERAA